jgi:hypothetical protein
VACGAGGEHLEKSAHSGVCYLAAAVAGGACLGRASFFTARARTFRAGILPGELDVLFTAFGDFIKGEFDERFEIETSLRGVWIARSATRSAAEDIAEYVSEVAEYVVDIHMRIVMDARSAQSVVAELIVSLAFFGVAQHLVSLGAFLELFLGLFVAGVFVGMELDGQLSVGLFDLIRCGRFAYAKNFVIVAFCHFSTGIFSTFQLFS